MNESILKSLMRLFAIVADVSKSDYTGNERDIVIDYLDRQYSDEIVQQYIAYFDEQVRHYHPLNVIEPRDKGINFEAINDICSQINFELEQEQKLIVVIYLLDFLYRGQPFSVDETKFLFSLVGQLKLDTDEFVDLEYFTFNNIDVVVNKERLLFIDSLENSGHSEIKHFPADRIDGRIVVLHIQSTNTYVFRYYGNMVLFINGHNIKPNRSYIWRNGAVIKNSLIGSLYFSRIAGRYIQANVEQKLVFTAEDIQYSYRNSGNGLKRFNLTEESGRLIGIIGGSGSGKSTLLNVLNGNLKPKKGNIKINGYDIHEQKEEVKGIIGFVPQDDVLIKELTVYKNLYYNARLCYSEYTEEQINTLVEEALVDFDLVEARDLNVGDAFSTILSGGQRKRLNIALELIREPSILFVDEPTSGLSSADSEKIITLLKRQALKGKLVITNIHQPSSDVYKMLDKLLIMDQGGRVIFYGNPMSAITYFKKAAKQPDAEESECTNCGNINSDQILRIVEARVVDSNGRLTRKRKTTPEEWYQLYQLEIDTLVKQTHREYDPTIPKSNFKIPSRVRQFKIYIERDLLAKYYNKQYLFISALEAPLLAVILAFFTKKYLFIDGIPRYIFGENPNLPAFIFMSVIVALFMGLVISAEEIFKDQKLLKREKFLNLSRSSYLFSKIIIMFLISAIQALIFVSISNYMLEIRGMWGFYWLIIFTTSCWANLVGLIISSGFNSVVTIYILVPIILVPQLLLSGVVVDFKNMHNKIASEKNVPLIGDMMTSRWSYEALMVCQYKENRFEKNFYEYDKEIKKSIFYKSFGIPELEKICFQTSGLKPSDSLLLQKNLAIIKNEINSICIELNWIKPIFVDSLNYNHFQPRIMQSVEKFLRMSMRVYVQKYNDAVKQREITYDNLVVKLGNEQAFYKFKQRYHNKQIAAVVTNSGEIYETAIIKNEIVPMKDAIFHSPLSNNGRAHFYAPEKRVFELIIDTFWYNLIIVWLFSGLMFVLLYFDILKKIITYVETLRLIRRNRLRLLRLLKVYEQSDKRK